MNQEFEDRTVRLAGDPSLFIFHDEGERTITDSGRDTPGVVLRVQYSDTTGTHVVKRVVYADSPLTIGRSPNCKLCLVDPFVSNLHAKITCDSLDGMVVEDCDSANGVLVNGERIFKKCGITEEDSIRLGESKLELAVLGLAEQYDGDSTIKSEEADKTPIVAALAFADDGGQRQERVTLRDRIRLGRDRNNDVVLDSASVSQRHAELVNLGQGRVMIRDLDSFNGVLVNGEAIDGKRELASGDVLRLGDVEIRVEY